LTPVKFQSPFATVRSRIHGPYPIETNGSDLTILNDCAPRSNRPLQDPWQHVITQLTAPPHGGATPETRCRVRRSNVSPRCYTPNFDPRRSTRREPNSKHKGGIITDNRAAKRFWLQRGAAHGRFRSPVRNSGALGPNEPWRRCPLPSHRLHGSTQAVAENPTTSRLEFVHSGSRGSAHSQIARSVVACRGDRGWLWSRGSPIWTPEGRSQVPRNSAPYSPVAPSIPEEVCCEGEDLQRHCRCDWQVSPTVRWHMRASGQGTMGPAWQRRRRLACGSGRWVSRMTRGGWRVGPNCRRGCWERATRVQASLGRNQIPGLRAFLFYFCFCFYFPFTFSRFKFNLQSNFKFKPCDKFVHSLKCTVW
jgi:hypothetical protein